MSFDGALYDGEAESRTFDFAAAVVLGHTVEPLENVRYVGGRDTHTIVGYADQVTPVGEDLCGYGDRDSPTGIFLNGVVHEIKEHLVPVAAIASEGGRCSRYIDKGGSFVLLNERGETADDIPGAGREIEWFSTECPEAFGIIRFEAGDGEHILDNAGNPFTVARHGNQRLRGLFAGLNDAIEQILEVAINDR